MVAPSLYGHIPVFASAPCLGSPVLTYILVEYDKKEIKNLLIYIDLFLSAFCLCGALSGGEG
jgi:hypothetical protein